LAARAGDQDVAAKVDAAETGPHLEGAVASYEQDAAEPVATATILYATVPTLLLYLQSSSPFSATLWLLALASLQLGR